MMEVPILHAIPGRIRCEWVPDTKNVFTPILSNAEGLKRGVTQEALAYDCGINRTYLSSLERSERNVSIDNIDRIAKALNVEAWKLLRDD